ncbi:MAG: dipeptidase [Phycisphaerales bacterium]
MTATHQSNDAAIAAVLANVDAGFEASTERLIEFLRIRSVSTDPAHVEDVREAAVWICNELSTIGFDASVRETSGHPIVVAHYRHPSGQNATSNDSMPHLLYYAHYDVQPPDPLDLWESPPFEPQIVDSEHGKKIVARGAVDDKGQLMLFVEAFRAWMAVHGSLPCHVSVILEGEEESGSPSLDPFLEANRDELQADVCIVSDTGMWDVDTPAITTMLRGLLYIEATLHGPAMDLHSGMYGGAVANPCNDLCTILAQLKDENDVVQIPGFYDDVEELPKEVKAQWDALDVDDATFLRGIGLRTRRGEPNRSVLERTWSRPTCDINGIYGGYTGKGAKTVIASHASAKLSCRLVPSQDPQKVLAALTKFLKDRTPPDCRWTIHQHGVSPAIRVAADSPWIDAARTGLARVYENETKLIGTGGSIPVVGSIQKILGFDSLLVGFGLDDDRVHSPNEKFEMRCFENGIKSHAAMLAAFAGVTKHTE